MNTKDKEKNLSSIFETVDDLLSQINAEKIDPNAPDFENLPEGYYSTEVVKAELTVSKNSGNPLVKLQLKTIENGLSVEIDEEGDSILKEIEKTKNRMVFKYYTLDTKSNVEKMIKDMLKFEGDEPGIPLLERDYFTNSELLASALEVLTGSRIYIQITISKNKNGDESSWLNLISWERAEKLELIDRII